MSILIRIPAGIANIMMTHLKLESIFPTFRQNLPNLDAVPAHYERTRTLISKEISNCFDTIISANYGR